MPDYKRLIRKKAPSRKISQEKKTPRGFLRKKIFLLMSAVLIFAVALAGGLFLINLVDFKIREISIINQNGDVVSNPEDFFCLDSDHDFRIFSFDLERAAQDIRARHPELNDVLIRKQFPDRLLIVVKQREPVALVALRDYYLVDKEGFILPGQAASGDLPQIVGVHPRNIQLYTQSRSLRLKRALQLLEELKKVRIYPKHHVLQIDIRDYSDVVFYLEDKIEVKMGESGFRRKAEILSRILVQLEENNTVPQYIDMRFDHPVIKP